MEEAKAACEHHMGEVASYIDRNESVPPSLAEVIKVSLTRHDPKFFAKTVPALENFSAYTGRMTTSIELLNRLKAGVTVIDQGLEAARKEKARLEGIK